MSMATCKYSFNALRRASSASSSAAVAQSASQKSVPQTKSGQFGVPQRVKLPKESVNVTKLSNGLVVASVENNSPVFRVGAVVQAGARHEPYESRGVTTLLRVFSNLSTKYVSRLGLTKNLERLGANFKCVQTREQMIYSIEGLRSELTQGAQFLVPAVCYPMFKPYEVHDERNRLEIDHQLYLQSPDLQLNDLLHEAAFKGGLSRALSVTPDMLKKLSHRQMYTFHSHYYTPDRLALVGTGCNHQTLVQLAEKFRFSPLDCVYTPGFGNLKLIDSEPEASKYKGGELRRDTQSSLVHIGLATEGVSSTDEKAVLTSSLLNEVLGTGPNMKWSAGSNRLQRAAQAVADAPCLVSSFNLRYTEAGLFGVHIMCDKNDANKVVKAVWNEFSKVMKNGISKDEYAVAKKKLQVNLQLAAEQSTDVFNLMLNQPDLSDRSTDIQALVGQLDQADLSNDSLNQLAKKTFGGKPTLVAIGNLKSMPYLDDLRA